MSICLNDIMNKFNIGLIGRKQVLGLVSRGEITFDDYRRITDERYKPVKRKPKRDSSGIDHQHIPKRVDRVRSSDADWYEWCGLLENGTLIFGIEQGNYAGGETTAYYFSKYYPNAFPGGCVYDDLVPNAYWMDVIHILKHTREYKPGYYQRISDMCERNKCGTILGLMRKIDEGTL